MTLQELRILPPLAIGRLGSATEPLDNYNLEVPEHDPLGFRKLVPAETLVVDRATGEITARAVPKEIRFKSGDRIRPVAPFLEVWAVTSEGHMEPLTLELLAKNGLSPADVKWTVRVGNIKAYRRTTQPGDQVHADTGPISDHKVHPLEGKCENFRTGKVLPLGSVQYIKPTRDFPEIRLRFTPAAGKVYGASEKMVGPDGKEVHDPNLTPETILYDPDKGGWRGYKEAPTGPTLTNPAQIYAGYAGPDNSWISRGYLDDECDGIVSVELAVKDASGTARKLSAFARIAAGPPAFAPDSFPVRTVADELEQALLGPEAHAQEAKLSDAEEIVRRAFETVRLMNTAVMNGNTIDGRVNVASTMVRQDTNDTGRLYEPIAAPSIVDNFALRNLHQQVFTALRSGTASWFTEVLRRYDEIGDLSDKGRRKMPALMRGADGRYMALTRRQVDIIRKTSHRELFQDGSQDAAPAIGKTGDQ